MFTDLNEVQSSKALVPILVTLFGILIEVNAAQPSKILFPILITLFGIFIEVND